MNAPKAFASLSGGLLARKGSAKPAMRRQGMGQVGPGGLDDLGWNDMGQDDPEAVAESKDNIEAINRAVATGLTPSQPVVHDQQAQLARQFASEEEEDGEEDSYDGADLDDDTAELWDPEADEEPNIFNDRRNDAKADAFHAPRPEVVEEDEPVEAEGDVENDEADETAPVASRDTEFDAPPVSQSMFGARGKVQDAMEETSVAEEEDGESPQLMRTVADLAPITPDQQGSAWGDEEESEEGSQEAQASDVPNPATDLSSDEDEDGEDVFGEEEEATADETAGDDFDPSANNRFSTFITRPSKAQALPDEDGEDEDELLLDDAMQIDAPAAPDSDVNVVEFEEAAEEMVATEEEQLDAVMPERRSVTSHEVAQAKAGAKDKAAFTLRLDRERHLKLRLACALTGQSAQKMVTEALDRLLGEMAELDELARQAGVGTERK